MIYPSYIQIEDKKIKINTSYKTAIKCFEIINDHEIDDRERSLAIIYLLVGDIPTDVDLEKLQKGLITYLTCNRKTENNGIPDMDYIQDERYIIASFRYDYNIDLVNTDMHWWEFINLLDGLSSECILSRVRDIRTRDLSEYKGKYRSLLQKAKEQVALKQTINVEDEEALKELDNFMNGGVKNE